MTKYTRGPWHAFKADYQRGPGDILPIFTIGPDEFHTVAQVRAGNTDDDLPAETEANATLIAAATVMLAALQAALPSLDSLVSQDCPDPDVNSHDIMIRAQVRAAIKLATEPTS
jgi:hypothetical protein